MKEQIVIDKPIEIPDKIKEVAPIWYAAIKSTKHLPSLTKDQTITNDGIERTINLFVPDRCILGEINGFTADYMGMEMDDADDDPAEIDDYDGGCHTCQELGNYLHQHAKRDKKELFEQALEDLADHISRYI